MSNSVMNNIVLSGGIVDLDKYIDSAHIVIKNDTIINAINLHNNLNIEFEIKEGCALTLNIFDYAIDLGCNLDIVLNDHSTFILNDAFITEEKYELNINTKLYGNDITADVNIRGINEEGGTVIIKMDGTVAGETHGNILNEYAKIINKSESSNVLIPNMIVNTNDVEANHGVTVSGIREDELFYLMSKGIDRNHASKIIEEGFLLSIMSEETCCENIKNILVGR